MAPSRVSPKVMHVYVFRLGTAPLDSAKYFNFFLCILYEFGVRIIYFGLFITYFLLLTDRSFSDIQYSDEFNGIHTCSFDNVK